MMTSRCLRRPPASTTRFDVQVIGTTMAAWEITPWSTWYSPWYSRERSIAATSLGSATTQMVDWSRLGLAQMEQGPSPSVRF